MTKPQYRIGQVLFVVPKDRPAVVPVQVIEQVLRTTADGEVLVYTVAWRVGNRTRTSELSNIAGEVFESPAKLQRSLVRRSTVEIDRMVAAARKRAEEYGFNQQERPGGRPNTQGEPRVIRRRKAHTDVDVVVKATDEDQAAIQTDEQGEFAHVQLPDGTSARVRM
jgi:hypothetical protein